MNNRVSSVASPFICRACRARGHGFLVPLRSFTTSPKGKDKEEKTTTVSNLSNREAQLHPSSKYSASFPRWATRKGLSLLTAEQFCSDKTAPWGKIRDGEIMKTKICTVYGRVISQRNHGSKLVFLNISSGGEIVQVLLSAKELFPEGAPVTQGHSVADFADFRKTVKRGDYIAVTGHPSRAIANLATVAEGRQTVRGIEVPQLLSPSLEVLPLDTTNPEVLMRNRHLDMLLHPQMAEPLVVRHRVLKTLRNFFDKQGFVEVSTPLIVTGAGGAAARPFETYATELSDTKLNLRVAPELWLKRLIIGGMERIFEIGPAFRNEGVDNTHNPEFTICEFYRVMISLEELIATTESLFHELALQTQSYKAELAVQNKSYRTESKPSIPHVDPSAYAGPYARLEFIPTLEREIQTHIPSWTCPDLTNSTTALPALLAVFAPLNIPVPAAHTLPTLLDVLAAHLIEPLCRNPTFITHHPDCMSPLAKSLTQPAHPTSGVRHAVSARAELFVNAREYVNCYEEENSPVAQRRKFERQLAFREQAGRAGDDALGTDREVDEGYLAALEWGMPPTGGWGCGVDRIVMLFSGRGRIADVLPFGTLRNVVGLGGAGARKQVEEEKGESGKSLEEAWKSGFEA